MSTVFVQPTLRFALNDAPWRRPYNPIHAPATVTGNLNLEAFFSPDWSIATYVSLIESAAPGTTLYIGECCAISATSLLWQREFWQVLLGSTAGPTARTPKLMITTDSAMAATWKSKLVCSKHCFAAYGTALHSFSAETFPVFPAILNAVHQRGVSVKILTNNYNTPTCRGYIAPLDYLALNGVEIVYYASTTFMHAKYLHVNGNKTSVSSVNFSWTSFNKNREAGIIMSGDDAAPLMSMMHSVFLDDFAAGTPYKVNQTYSSSEMATITSKDAYPVVIPAPQKFPGNYITPKPTPIAGPSTVTAFTSPDAAQQTLLADVTSATKSFQLHMYQITDPNLCTLMEKLHVSGINTTLMVSAKIFSSSDSAAAHVCYNQLLKAGLQVRLTPSYYTFSHQKYWIVDGNRMGLSTGNWSPTDYPPVLSPTGQYPPYGDANWQRVNRDFNLLVAGNANFLDIFATTFEQDFARGSWYSPSSPLSSSL